MDVTVAICTWNRASLLDETLTGFRQLVIPDGLSWEIVVVNNNCTDTTDEVIERHREGGLPVRRLFEPVAGLSMARNRALAEARGDLVLWTDDDVLVDPAWVSAFKSAADRYLEAAYFGGVIDPWFPIPPDPDLLAAFPSLRIGFCGRNLGPEERPLQPGEHVYGANMGMRRSRTEGLTFDARLGPVGKSGGLHDDVDIQGRIDVRGLARIWVPTMRVRHYVDPERMTPAYMLMYSGGSGKSEVLQYGPPNPDAPRLFGVPRYLIRQCGECYVRRMLAWVRSDRRTMFQNARQYAYYRGMIRGCREFARTAGRTG